MQTCECETAFSREKQFGDGIDFFGKRMAFNCFAHLLFLHNFTAAATLACPNLTVIHFQLNSRVAKCCVAAAFEVCSASVHAQYRDS